MDQSIELALIICALIFSIIALGAALVSIATVKGFERSTHRIYQVQANAQEFDPPLTKEQIREMTAEPFDNI